MNDCAKEGEWADEEVEEEENIRGKMITDVRARGRALSLANCDGNDDLRGN